MYSRDDYRRGGHTPNLAQVTTPRRIKSPNMWACHNLTVPHSEPAPTTGQIRAKIIRDAALTDRIVQVEPKVTTPGPQLLSIVVPCYNEEESVGPFFERLSEVCHEMGMAFECIFVDDGSADRTLARLRELHAKFPTQVRFIELSRNFGKEAALLAGLRAARGNLVAVMDADLQDPPELLPQMVALIDDGYDTVATRRVDRSGEPPIRSFFARKFYKWMNRVSHVKLVDGARDFRLMNRQVVDSVLGLTEYNRFSKGLFSWVGYKTAYVEFENAPRLYGTTKWNFWGLFRYSIDGFVNFSSFPLQLSVMAGIVVSLAALVSVIIIVIRALLMDGDTPGWASLISIVLFLGGIQLLSIGILGEYLGKLFLETKHRPAYLVRDSSEGHNFRR